MNQGSNEVHLLKLVALTFNLCNLFFFFLVICLLKTLGSLFGRFNHNLEFAANLSVV